MSVPVPKKLEALQRWGRIARKEITPDLVDWLADVAAQLIAATDEKDANRRRVATVKAVGLDGKASLRTHAVGIVVHESAQLIAPGERAKMTRVMVGLVTNNAAGTPGEISPEAMRKRIERAKRRKPRA